MEDTPPAGVCSPQGPAANSRAVQPPMVPDYELLRRVGVGAYGEIWLARSTATGVWRAAKIVWRHSFDDDRPFQREFEGIQRFERISRAHPSQLALFHIGRNDAVGYFYYVMELADDIHVQRSNGVSANGSNGRTPAGQSSRPTVLDASEYYVPHTLRTDLAHGTAAAARVLEIGLALTEALGHLHRHGLVHRDVKPSNVIFVNGRPKLADIGLVTDAGDTRSIVGTEGYLAPEGPGSPQADLFALGRVLYEAVTGLDRRQLPQLPPDLRAWPDARLVFELNEVILKACASDPRQRYATAMAMLGDLDLLQRGRSVKRRRTRQQLWAACVKTVAALIILVIISAVLVIGQRQLTRPVISSDGPPSPIKEATKLCDKGMSIIRADSWKEFAEAYTNFIRASEIDTNFARPYVGLLDLRLRHWVPGLDAMSPAEWRRLADKLKELAPDLGATAPGDLFVHKYRGRTKTRRMKKACACADGAAKVRSGRRSQGDSGTGAPLWSGWPGGTCGSGGPSSSDRSGSPAGPGDPRGPAGPAGPGGPWVPALPYVKMNGSSPPLPLTTIMA